MALQPAQNQAFLHDVNVVGSSKVFDAAAEAGVGASLYASSRAAYSSILTREPVDETRPTDGIRTSRFSRQKAHMERLLDRFELDHPRVRTVRLRSALTLKAETASKVRREFRTNPVWSVASRLRRVSLLPSMPGVVVRAVHTDDVAEAYRLALLGSIAAAFNVSAEPGIDADVLAASFKLRSVPVGARTIRKALAVTWGLGMHSVEPGWIDLARLTPLLDSTRAHKELGWVPRRSSVEALRDLADGLEAGSGFETPSLRHRAGTSRR
jgi:nucleoside-diphosphate-sugar epimerase